MQYFPRPSKVGRNKVPELRFNGARCIPTVSPQLQPESRERIPAAIPVA